MPNIKAHFQLKSNKKMKQPNPNVHVYHHEKECLDCA